MAVRDARRKTIAIDFDGVLSTVDSEAARDVLRRLHGQAKLIVFTARRDHDWVQHQLEKRGIWRYFSYITSDKPAADLYVDDRAFHFTGDWDAVEVAVLALEAFGR